MLFKDWVQKELNTQVWKNADLEKRANLDSGLVSRLLSGERSPSVKTCKAIAKAFDLPQETVFRAAGILDPNPEADPLMEEWDHIFDQATTEEERQRLIAIARFELKRILEQNK